MPEQKTKKKAQAKKREGQSASSQAGEFVREEIHHVRQGKHGARSPNQAIAIGLSKARKAGVRIPNKKNARGGGKSERAAAMAAKPSAKRSRATLKALKREPKSTVSKKALSKQGKQSAKMRGTADMRRAAEIGAQTRNSQAA